MGGIAVTPGLLFVHRRACTADALLRIQCFSLLLYEWPQFMYTVAAISTSFACIR